MKILHISTFDNAGAGLCCLRIHLSQLNMGVDSKMVVMHNTKGVDREYQYGYFKIKLKAALLKALRSVGLQLTDSNRVICMANQNHTTYTLPLSVVDLSKNEWVEWADVIHLHWVNGFLDYPSFFRKVKKPIVWTLHDENLFYGIAHHHNSILHNYILENKYRDIKYNAIRSIENLSIVFLSQKMYDDFGKEPIIEGRRKVIISNSVNTDVYVPKNKNELRNKYGICDGKKRFLFISMNIADSNKGLDILSEVLLGIDPEIEILAIGDNPWHKEWKNVRSVGLVNNDMEMCDYINCADYMAMTSYQESFSQSIIEAMACGLPAVAFPVGVAPELINKKNGVLCKDLTRNALNEAIKELLTSNYDVLAIRQDIVERFSPEIIAQKYIDLYEDQTK